MWGFYSILKGTDRLNIKLREPCNNAHVGVDADSGIVHRLETSTAKVYGSRVWDEWLHGGETSIKVDKAYVSADRKDAFAGPDKFWGVMRKAPKGGDLHPIDEQINHLIAKVRSRVEHPFRVLKRQFGCIKTRYRGLAKNRANCSACSPSAICISSESG